MPQLNPSKWAGIDCAGLVQRVMMIGLEDSFKNSGINLGGSLPALSDAFKANGEDTMGLGSMEFDCDGLAGKGFDKDTGKCKTSPSSTVEAIKTARVYRMKTSDISALKKGDLIFYYKENGISHISFVYKDVPVTCSGNSCTYEIIHAYGDEKYQPFDDNGKKDGPPVFSRKVIKTKQNISATPTGFGRIKLWD
jgi:hypothetical protein